MLSVTALKHRMGGRGVREGRARVREPERESLREGKRERA
jgi:hypothetical protein